MADALLILGGVALVHLAGAASPGPSFVVVARTAAARGRATGAWMSLGMGVGATFWAAAALFGLAALFAAAPWLYDVVRLAGAAFLLWLSFLMIRHAEAPLDVAPQAAPLTPWAAFRQATLVQLSNPKVMVFFASVFVAVVPPETSPALLGLILLNVLVVEAAWYGLVALAFSAGPIRTRYLAAKAWIDRVCGGALGLIGLRLALG